jgi:hypothetical protein
VKIPWILGYFQETFKVKASFKGVFFLQISRPFSQLGLKIPVNNAALHGIKIQNICGSKRGELS